MQAACFLFQKIELLECAFLKIKKIYFHFESGSSLFTDVKNVLFSKQYTLENARTLYYRGISCQYF